MILDKTQAELIIEEARIDSPLMQCILKSIEIKNMIDLAYERKSDYQNYNKTIPFVQIKDGGVVFIE